MIVGQPGSGKSSLARSMALRSGLPVIHIDKIHWRPGWVERGREEKTRLCRDAEAGDRWIFEGGHSATWDSRVARADLLIWIDRPLMLRLWRVLRRTLTGLGRTRPDLPEDCPEQLRRLPEFIRFIWSTRQTARARLARLAATAPPTCRVVRLRSDRETRAFLSRLEPTRLTEPIETTAPT
jgi:adenylate kinase family enzyme